MSTASRLGLGDLFAVLALLAAGWASARGSSGPAVALLNLGPNDGSYLSGFAPLYEIEPESQRATRWSGTRPEIELPLELSGPAEVLFESARVLPQTAEVEVGVAGVSLDRFSSRGGRDELHRVSLGNASALEARLWFRVDSHDGRGLGLRFDWVAFRVGEGGKLSISGWPRALLVALPGALFLAFRCGNLSSGLALLFSLAIAAAQLLLARADAFAAAHLASKVALPSLLLTLVVALAFRRHPRGSLVAPLFALGLLAKAGGVFHPGFYYPDVMNHRRYVHAFAQAEGGLVERGVSAQKAVNTAYPRYVAGKAYAFPYSPLFFVPFAGLPDGDSPRDADRVEDALRWSALAAGALEVPLAFAIAGRLAGPEAAALAAAVAAMLAPMYSRLLLAMWPTVVGHLLDLLAILAALRASLATASPWRAFAWAFGSCLTYISSLFNLSLFFSALAACDRSRWRWWLGIGLAATGLTVVVLFLPFTVVFVTEILPAVLWGAGRATAATTAGMTAAPQAGGLLAAPLAALSRAAGFYGPVTLALAAIGAARAVSARPAVRHALLAWGLAFLVLLSLRGFGGGLFKDLKEVLFVEPLVAVLCGAALAWIAESRFGKLWTALLLAAIALFGAQRYQLLLETHRAASVKPPAALSESARLPAV